MNVLFLTLVEFESLQDRNIYTDLLRDFVKNGHKVFVISPIEKRKRIKTHLVKEESATILRLQIGNAQKTNVIEKGISTVMIEPTYKKAIRKYFSDVRFDLVLYSTPPITLVSAIEYVKKRDGAKTYLLLKDIFPQNAVDIGMISKTGIKGVLFKHFRRQEKKLYKISDRIGCMSQANVDYVIKHNPEVDPSLVEVCPNSIEVIDKSADDETRKKIRFKQLNAEERNELIRQDPRYGRIICRCETVTEGEIVKAIHGIIPAVSIDGVKRRCNAGMGRCQGGFCGGKVAEILVRERGISPLDVLQDQRGTNILVRELKVK